MQVLTRRLRFRLEKSASDSGSLIDRSGCSLKMEPLTTVTALEKYLLKMVHFPWLSPHFKFLPRIYTSH